MVGGRKYARVAGYPSLPCRLFQLARGRRHSMLMPQPSRDISQGQLKAEPESLRLNATTRCKSSLACRSIPGRRGAIFLQLPRGWGCEHWAPHLAPQG